MSSLFGPLIHPVVNDFVPKLRIQWLSRVLSFVGKIQHLGWDALHLQRGEEIERLCNVGLVIALAVDDQSRDLEIFGVLLW